MNWEKVEEISNIKCYISTKKTTLHGKEIYKEYCQHFLNYQELWFLIHRFKIYLTLYIRFSTILFNKVMMKISNIYVSITGYLFQYINIYRQSKNSQDFMLAHPVFHKISIDTFKKEIFWTFIFSDGAYTTSLLNSVKMEEISKI